MDLTTGHALAEMRVMLSAEPAYRHSGLKVFTPSESSV